MQTKQTKNLVNRNFFSKRYLGIYLSVIAIFIFYSLWLFLTSNPVASEVGCGWDGSQYCLMFSGEDALEPYRRRVLPPFLARQISDSPLTAFLVLDLTSMAIVAISLTYVVVSHARNATAAWAGSIFLGTLVATSRNTFHHFINAPVLTDYLALAGISIFFAGVTAISKNSGIAIRGFATLIMISGVLIGSFSREPLAPAFAAASIVMVFHKGNRLPFASSLFVATAATAYLILNSSAGSSIQVILGWISEYFQSWTSFSKFLGMISLSLGIFPLLAAFHLAIRKPPKAGVAILSFAIPLFCLSVFGGGNLDRILLPVGIAIATFVAISIESKLSIISAVLAGIGYTLSQYPFLVMEPGARNFLGFIDFWHSASNEEFVNFGIGGLMNGLPFTIVAIILMVVERRGYVLDSELRRSA